MTFSEPSATYDVVVVGGGPAGLAAAVSAAEHGASVVLLDAGARPGGQYWRSGATPDPAQHHGWSRFVALQARAAGVEIRSAHTVQTVSPGFVLRCAVGPEPRATSSLVTVRAARLVLATGAYDRQLPFPGWDLPGVMTAGGAQALLKGHGVAAGQRVVVAGTGPFLLPVATGLLAAGAQVAAVVEANSPVGFARYPRAVLSAVSKLGEAAGYATRLARTRTPYLRRRRVVRALGTDSVTGVELDDGRHLDCDLLAVGWGFTPQLDLHLQAGVGTAIGADGSLVAAVDDRQRTGVDGVWAAGESTGIGGADLALVEGEIAGLDVAGAAVPPRLLARRERLRRFAAAMHAVHPLPPVTDVPDDVLVCRCEEVSAGAVRRAVRGLGATDARTVKLLARPGMGWCQGRVCGTGCALVTADANGREVGEADLRAFAERPFAVPLPLRHLLSD